MDKYEKKKLIRAERIKLELARRKKRTRKIAFGSMIVILVICLGIYITLFTGGENKIVKSSDTQSETEILIPLSGINGEAVFYSYNSNGVEMQFFVIKDSEGEVRIALDACDLCYGAKKGYRQKGEVMQCINCGNEYLITGLGTENVQGGCWPSYIPMRINGDNVVIEKSDLDAKRYMFL